MCNCIYSLECIVECAILQKKLAELKGYPIPRTYDGEILHYKRLYFVAICCKNSCEVNTFAGGPNNSPNGETLLEKFID